MRKSLLLTVLMLSDRKRVPQLLFLIVIFLKKNINIKAILCEYF